MALSDPQSVTVGSVTSLPRITQGANSNEYASADGGLTLLVSHQVGKGRRRSLVKIMRKKISTDVLTDVKTYVTSSINISFDRPEVAFTEAELVELVTGATTWLTASTNANAKAVLGLQS